MRLLNVKLFKRNDLSALTFQGFVELFIQVAIFVFSKPPDSLSHLPPSTLAAKLLDLFHQSARQRGERTPLYDNPHATSLADKDVISQLTRLVATDPAFRLPEGYRKIESRLPQNLYSLRDYFEVPEAITIAAEIVDSVMESAVGTHFLEPLTGYMTKTSIVPAISRPTGAHLRSSVAAATREPRKQSVGPVRHHETPGNRRSLSRLRFGVLEDMSAKMTPAMKLAVACAGREEKPLVREVAEVMGEIVDAVARGRGYIIPIRHGSVALNRALKEKAEREREEGEMRREMEQKRKRRHEKLRRVVEESRAGKEKRQADELQRKY